MNQRRETRPYSEAQPGGRRPPDPYVDGDGRVAVVHVALDLALGGAEKLLVEFARRVDPRRYALSFVALGEDGPIGAELRETGSSVVTLRCPDGRHAGLPLKLAGLLRKQRARIVHTHLDRPHIYGTAACMLAGVKSIVHTRHGHCDQSPRQRRLINWLAWWTAHFVCVSHQTAQEAAGMGVPRARIRTIQNGIDLERFRFASPAADGPVVTVARLSAEKDLETLVRATAIAAQQDPDLQVEIAGDGPCRQQLVELAARLRVEQRVRFLGPVDDVASLLSRAALFVLPSRAEGIPLTLLEAQASGVPVIATRVGGNPEVILDGRTGVLVPPGQPEALAGAMVRMRRDPALCRSMAAAGRLRVEQCFDVNQMVSRYEQLYESMVAGEVRGRGRADAACGASRLAEPEPAASDLLGVTLRGWS